MDLKSGKLYWNTTLSNVPTYTPLEQDIQCDVLIIGGGVSGAQCAYYLSDTGLDVVVIDKDKVGYGSTCTNTALVQYLGDKMYFELANSFGEDNATRHMKLCEDAINDIEKSCASLNINADFFRRDSLYYASYEEDVNKLQKEYECLKKHGFKAELLNEEQIGKLYPFKKRSALYVTNDAEVNPYKFTINLLEKSRNKGVRIFEGTEVKGRKLEKDSATFFTKNGHVIKAHKVIFAAGYENLEFKAEKNAVLTSSYAVVTNEVKDLSKWHKRTLIWETARPYIYMRTTADNRIIIGGLDEDTTNAKERDSKLLHKKDKLIKEFNKLFPDINVYPEFYLGAVYGGTHDGLPIIGIYEDLPNCYLLFAYGDNGMVYSMVLSKIIRDLITKISNPALDIYHESRPILKHQYSTIN